MTDVARAPLRIAVIATARYAIRQPFAGGLESLVWHLVTSLRERGHEVTLFAGEGSDGSDVEYAFPSSGWEPSRVASRDVSMPPAAFMSDHHSYLKLLMGLAGPLADRFDVVHNHALHHLPVAMSPLLPQPVLTTLHTPPTPWLESAINAAPQPSGHFAAVSGFIAAQWKTLRPTPRVVLNGVDLETWRLGQGGPTLAWSGRIVPEKAPHLAIEAARRAGMGLVLAGPLSDLPYFESVIRPLLGAGVTYAGHLGTDDLAGLVGSSAAVLVTPVWDEPYGLVVAEAIACGTPVVAFARGGIPEVMPTSGLGALVQPHDVAALAAAIPAVVELDRTAVRDHAVRHLSRARMVSRYERIYGQLRQDATQEDSLPA